MLANRRQAFAERLPLLQVQEHSARLAQLDTRREELGTDLTRAEQLGDGATFADSRERALAARLERARAALARLDALAGESGGELAGEEGISDAARNQARARLRRVEGALGWQLGQELPQRLWNTKKNWTQLTDQLTQAHEHQVQLIQAQQSEPAHFDQFAVRIEALKLRIQALKPRVNELIALQRQAVQELAVAELEQQKDVLVAYGNQARFAVAQIYDRAGTHADANREQEPANAPKP
jgi:hypothetical protein